MGRNVRRNTAKAIKSDPDLRIERLLGIRAAGRMLQMLMMRGRMSPRKGNHSGLGDAIEFSRRMIFLNRYVLVDRVIYMIARWFLLFIATSESVSLRSRSMPPG